MVDDKIMIKMDAIFREALPILDKLEEKGFEAYFVGGSVRDALLGQEINDIDIASSAFPQEVKAIFNQTIDVGIEHGTVMVLYQGQSYEITTLRTESTYQDYRRPDSVTFVRSLEEDLKRRDFTINAFAMDREGRIIDYFQGLKDLDNQVIRSVGKAQDRFHEDALRMMRALRFQSQLAFSIEKETRDAIESNAHLLEKIAVERIRVEWIKLLLGQAMPQAINTFVDTGVYRYCPKLQGQAESIRQVGHYQARLENEVQAWTLLFFHLNFSDDDLTSFLKAWKSPKDVITKCKACLKGLKWRVKHSTWDERLLYDLGEEIVYQVEQLMQGLGLSQKGDLEEALARYHDLAIQSRDEMAISGQDLLEETGIKPGKWLGDLLTSLEEQLVRSEISNQKETLLTQAKEELKSKGIIES